jgi:hypothetical protein
MKSMTWIDFLIARTSNVWAPCKQIDAARLPKQPSFRNACTTSKLGRMTNAFASMGYPHWLMIAGGLLVMLGFIGLATRRGGEPETIAGEREIFKLKGDLAEAEVDDQPVEQKRRDRWAERELVLKEASDDGAEFYGRRSA